MLKKTIEFEDFNGNKQTKDFYFNLTKAELVEMQLGTKGGMAQKLQDIIDAKDIPTITKTFKEIILKAYGEKSDDGLRFIKNEELREAFQQTNAYSELFMELADNSESAANFINAIIPKDIPEDHNQKKTESTDKKDEKNVEKSK